MLHWSLLQNQLIPDNSSLQNLYTKTTYIIFTKQLKWIFIYKSLGYSNLS